MKTIDLWSIDNLHGIVVCMPTGIMWTNQAGGTMCAQPEAEGLFVPLEPFDLDGLVDWWRPDIGIIRDCIAKEPSLRANVEARDEREGGEAWVPVRIVDEPATEVLRPFAGMDGFLVYVNSD